MKKILGAFSISGLFLLAAGYCPSACSAQTPPPTDNAAPSPAQRAEQYSTIAKLPDWAGIWVLDFGPVPGAAQETPVLTPTAEAQLKINLADEAKNAPPPSESANCLPPGMPTIMFQPYDVEFLFTPGRVTIIQEAYMQVRRVFTDGRSHPANPDPTFNGNSIGHWEGDTLVIDTVGLGHRTPLGYHELMHGPHLHVIERIQLLSPDKMEDDMTLIDPDVLAKPWHEAHTFTRHRDWDQIEYICEENNRNPIENGQISTELRK
ncbi:MAG: hypothetical protein ACRD5K_00665 [Candidatus Acidiferrales bacterium]